MGKFAQSRLWLTCCAGLLCLNTASGSGFQIGLESAADMGYEFAGGAAIADDASANFYNAAGITRATGLEMSLSATGVKSSTRFRGTATTTTPPIPPIPTPFGPIPIPPTTVTETGSAKMDSNGVIPAIHFRMPVPGTESFFLGMSFTAPYGLGVDFPDDSILRYASTKAAASSALLSPSLAVKIGEHISIGGGPDWQYFDIEVENFVLVPGTSADSFTKVKGDGWEKGWHVGMLVEFNERTRFGASYRSNMEHKLSGRSSFIPGSDITVIVPVPVAPFGPGDIELTPIVAPLAEARQNNTKIKINTPAVAMASIFHSITPNWAVMATFDYTFWKTFDKVTLQNVASPVGPVTRESPQNYRNSAHIAVGTQYQVHDKVLLKLGVGADATPSNQIDRSVIIPNSNNVATTIGFRFTPLESLSIDVAYSHAFIDTADINHTEPGVGTTEVGRSKTNGKAAGIQLNWSIT